MNKPSFRWSISVRKLLSALFPHCFRQDVANQMCTKTKEECEKYYMKHFINNPLFASTLLTLKQAEAAKTADTAIPFHCKCLPIWVRGT